MKNTGIWLDKEQAIIITLENGKESMSKIPSKIEFFNIKGGSGTRLKGGPQDVIQDSKYLEREKHQYKKYFKTIVSKIKDTDALVIFGPAQTNEKFGKELKEHYTHLGNKIKGLRKADSMTDNQVKSWVRDFFN